MSILKTISIIVVRSEEHTSELQSHSDLVCRLLLDKKNKSPNTLSTRASGFHSVCLKSKRPNTSNVTIYCFH